MWLKLSRQSRLSAATSSNSQSSDRPQTSTWAGGASTSSGSVHRAATTAASSAKPASLPSSQVPRRTGSDSTSSKPLSENSRTMVPITNSARVKTAPRRSSDAAKPLWNCRVSVMATAPMNCASAKAATTMATTSQSRRLRSASTKV